MLWRGGSRQPEVESDAGVREQGGGGVEEDDKLYEIPKFLSKGEEPSMVRIYQPTLVMIHSLPNISYSII